MEGPLKSVRIRATALVARLSVRLRSPANLASAAALLALSVLAVRHCQEFRANLIDDAFITLRYADNLAHGRGFVFNPGERVEGTSTFLETLLLALLRAARADLVDAAQLIGVASHLALIAGTFWLVRSLSPENGRLLGVSAATVVAASMSLAIYAMSGLETTLFAALLLLGIGLHLRAWRSPGVGTMGWSLAMSAVALTRPEGVGYFAILWGAALARDVVGRAPLRHTVRSAASGAGWFLLPVLPMLAFRQAYFHAWVPNTLTAKSNMLATFHGKSLAEIASALADGAAGRHVGEYATMLGVAAYLVPAGLLRRSTRYPTFVLLATIGGSLVVDALDDGDWMPAWRLLTPAIAPLAVAVALGLGALLFRPDQRLWRTHLPSALVALVVCGQAAQRLYPGGWSVSAMDDYRVWLGKTLAQSRRDDDLLATDMAGVVPFYSGMRALDMNGLCDRYIALHGSPLGPMGKIDRRYVIERRPTFFQPNFTGEMRALYDDPAFAPMRGDYYAVITDGYRKAARVRDRKLLAVRKDRPGVRELAVSLGAELVDLGQQLQTER